MSPFMVVNSVDKEIEKYKQGIKTVEKLCGHLEAFLIDAFPQTGQGTAYLLCKTLNEYLTENTKEYLKNLEESKGKRSKRSPWVYDNSDDTFIALSEKRDRLQVAYDDAMEAVQQLPEETRALAITSVSFLKEELVSTERQLSEAQKYMEAKQGV